MNFRSDIGFIQERLNAYRARTAKEENRALREILQEYILAALSRTDYFTKAAFHGGTHLRIFHAEELSAIGLKVEVKDKSKADLTVKKGFLKDDSLIRLVQLQFPNLLGSRQTPRKILIKVEVDSNPPAGAVYQSCNLSFPFTASVTNFDLPSSFAGKMHALLCREYVKGRDWYDFIWYVGRKVKLNHRLLSAALDQQGRWAGQHVVTSDAWVREELKKVIAALDFEAAKEDVANFVYAGELGHLDYFNREFFAAMAEKL